MATFLALQCYNCNTMQAKQQKKSSNKWACAICNEKQSVQKVFARSSLAKDIRKFVQDFNMSTHLKHTQAMHLALQTHDNIEEEEQEEKAAEKSFPYQSKWSEYLEAEHENKIADNDDDDFTTIVTVLPDPPLGKRKRQANHISKGQPNSRGSSKFGKTLDNYGFSAANQKKTQSISPSNGGKIASIIGHVNKAASPRHEEGGGRTQNYVKQVSKWASYLEAESGTESSRFGGNWNNDSAFQGILQTEWQDQVYDEDVHPDFL